jgi:DNA modification methylase
MGKTVADLKKSRDARKIIVDKYGNVPTSVWDISYSSNSDIIEFGNTQAESCVEKHKKMGYDKSLFHVFSSSSRDVRGKSGGLSVFPPMLAYKVINFYTKEGDIVLDPSSGHNSRMQMTYKMRRNYIGYDVSKKFMAFNRSVALKLKGQRGLIKNNCEITLHEQSSERMVEKSHSVDFCFTSPPYFNTEYYGDEQDQLGNSLSYDDFMLRLTKIIGECHRVLKKGGFCVFNVNDFRSGGVFYPFHADVMRSYAEVGFKIWDVIIVKWASSIAACFASQVEERKRTAKIHEYLIVGKKE